MSALNHPILKRFNKAHAQRRLWDEMLFDAYRLCLPNYGPLGTTSGADASKGEKRGVDVYDGTGGEALDDRAAYTVGGLFPNVESWIVAQKGTQDANDAPNVAFDDLAEKVFKNVQGAFDTSNFMAEIIPAMREAYISIGAIACDFGDPNTPLNFEAIPIGQVTPEDSFDGVIRTNYRQFNMPIKDIRAKWKDVKVLPETLVGKLFSDPSARVKIVEAEIYNHDTRRTDYSVVLQDDGTELMKRADEVGRSILFRVDKAPGETMGRGPVLSAMPDIKVLNTADELVLKNASIAVTGMWQAEDDGVLNIANINLVPGAIIPKAQGSSGLTPLQAPGRFDISQLLIDDRRARVRRRIFGQHLPPVEGAGNKTAFEIGERVRKFETIEGPHLRRLVPELFMRLVRRALYILMHPSMAGSRYAVQVADGYDPSSFLDILMDALESPEENVKRKHADLRSDQAVANAIQALGSGVGQVLDVAAYFRGMLKREGVGKDLIVDAKTAQAAAQQSQMAQAAQAAAASPQAAASPNGSGAGPALPPHLQMIAGGLPPSAGAPA